MPEYASYPSLIDRTVLVTGGATGIGASLVEHFAREGARVGFIDIDTPAGNSLAARLVGSSAPPVFVAADLTDTPALTAALDARRAGLGPSER